jgi:uncharacterized protein (TIGR02246 family)
MTSNSEQAAIAALTQRMVTGWAYGEAETIADLFVDDGTLILPGVFCNGREEIRDYFVKAFEGRYKGTQVTGKPISIRALDTDTAILLSYGGVLESGETEVSDSGAIRASWLCVRRDGQWKLAAYQNSPRYDTAVDGAA